jgi:hypothetical protein
MQQSQYRLFGNLLMESRSRPEKLTIRSRFHRKLSLDFLIDPKIQRAGDRFARG